MFTAAELQTIDRNYFTVVVADCYDVTLISNNTKHVWYMEQILAEHDVTWSRKDSFCDDRYSLEQPEELPTAPVKETIYQIKMPATRTGFEKFNFAEGLEDE